MKMGKSNLEIAYEIVKSANKAVKFQDIWSKIVAEQGYTEEEAARQIGRFYTNLSLDGRFVTLGENTWDLRVNHTFDKVHIDMNDVYTEDEEEDESEQDEEEKEYNKVFEDEKSDEDDDSLDEENEEDK